MSARKKMGFIDEPMLEFGHGQRSDDPRTGLFLFGPVEKVSTTPQMRVGVLGTAKGIELYSSWVEKISEVVAAPASNIRKEISFPGFQSAFNAIWPTQPLVSIKIDEVVIRRAIRLSNKFDRVYQTATIFVERIEEFYLEEEPNVDLWFIIVPDEVYKYCRPKSFVPGTETVRSKVRLSERQARVFLTTQPSLFREDMEEAHVYEFHPDFHDQIKARLLKKEIAVQIVRESSLEPLPLDGSYPSRRRQDDFHLAWNLCTTAYFKAIGRPWKLSDIREGVCYVGLVFKHEHVAGEQANACCGAQMFLDSGDGLVFKGVKGNYYKESTKQFHLSREVAAQLINAAVEAYRKRMGSDPKELFVHGRTFFNREEYEGFCEGAPNSNVVAVRIRADNELKMFTDGALPILRGAYFQSEKQKAFLWANGFIPKLKTYPGRETPNPLAVQIINGESNLEIVLRDVLSLTKVNFNTCVYADGSPVTLRFADRVGEILTAAKIEGLKPLPFKHYI